MKKFSITDSEKKLLFIVLSLAMLAGAYFFGFSKLTDAAKAVEESNEKDSATVAQLESMVARQAETQKETEEFKKNIQKIIDKYPSGIPQEKTIYLVQEFQDIIGTDVESITFSMDNHVQSFSGDDAPVGKYDNLNINYNCDYNQFKELLRYVGELSDRTTIPAITASFDQASGRLRGNLSYRMFYLTNTGKAYEEVPPTGIPSGKGGIFYPGDSVPDSTLATEE